MKDQKIEKKTAQLLLKINAASFRFDPPFTYTSGLTSPIYLDNRLVLSYPDVRRQIVKFYIAVIKDKIGLESVDYISGTASAAIPQASWIAGSLNLPMVYVRPSSKKYGKGNKLEGYLKRGSRVLIIEDHISTASSVVNSAETIRKLGGMAEHCVATTTYETEKSKEALAGAKLKLLTLTTGKIIVEEAVRGGLLTGEQKASVDRWFENPEEWRSADTS